MTIHARKTLIALVAISACLVAVGWAVEVVKVTPEMPHFPNILLRRVSLIAEGTIPSWYSSLLLASASVLLAAAAFAEPRRGRDGRQSWAVLSVIFLYLSADEAAALHETTVPVLVKLGIASGFLYYPWVVLGIVFVVLLALYLFPWLRGLERQTRRLFLISACLFVGGAVGFEMIGARLAESTGSSATVPWVTLAAVEEGLEMLGSSVFVYALLTHLQRVAGGFRLTIE
jgi:hypothetical protein